MKTYVIPVLLLVEIRAEERLAVCTDPGSCWAQGDIQATGNQSMS